MAAPTCVNCGRLIEDAPEARREGDAWFCSPSCQLTYASRSTRSSRKRWTDRGSDSKPQSRGAVRTTARVVGKTVKWILISTAVLVGVVIALAVVGLHHAVVKSERNAARVTPAKFAKVKQGMTPRQVRRLLGRPEDTSTATTGDVTTTCWFYGTLSDKGSSWFCFTGGKLSSKTRTG